VRQIAEVMAEVGVMIAAFNAEQWLAQALESVLLQTSLPGDVLVLDDGSSDATAGVARSFDAPVRVVSDANAGIGAARNRGVELVRGELLAFLDADDLLTPVSLAARLDVLRRRPDVDMVFGQGHRFERLRGGAPVPIDELSASHTIGSMFVRRSALERVGPFIAGTRVSEGLDWLLRARELGLGEATVPEQVLWRRVHGQNNSLRHRDAIGEFAHTLKASLDRRRALARAGSDELESPRSLAVSM
jgi:glycosyltransferase involved in cell wall biosynthesis